MQLTALLVHIELNTTAKKKSAKYPDFGSLASVIATGLDWSEYVDRFGAGWAYDKLSGHEDDDNSRSKFKSQRGEQLGVLLVPEVFADEAVIAFPTVCSIIKKEVDFEDFWDNLTTAHLSEKDRDVPELQGLKAERDLRVDLSMSTAAIDVEIAFALDENDPKPGVKKNNKKKWTDFKVRTGITFKEKA